MKRIETNVLETTARHKIDGRQLLRKFVPLFILAALIPVVLLTVLSREPFKFFARSDEIPQLRIWFEPAIIIAEPNTNVTLRLIAEFESGSQLIPSLSAGLHVDEALLVLPTTISYKEPFRGRTNLADIQVTAREYGTFTIDIPNNNVITPFSNLMIVTSPVTILAKSDF